MQAWQASCAAIYAARAPKQIPVGAPVAQATTVAAPAATAAEHIPKQRGAGPQNGFELGS